ncbi:UDP-4-amino-4,6-dideoxy-N-acetyl-beta-L-altrosamine transaminase [Halarcobacter anaerophilus]|uniref:UDP-4-amino-4,6-dideoxy-N-acetyl-beta-L-altrosamine transaminase n=1 Tax=Halarcobacter anaerophilus TaxID=877500 RepID=A0A4Q0Y1U8_9BACT|nr:UDP-4-amino-4,6-dideoxy-N-acetyl-beta-L-altrosamine transaminase [Halarcobacter anaerophilus]QDF30240.1 UDP-2-acetamido-2,6-dideoxy-beta-L-arabino-hex-4-ulose aminotransferase [Halarcobacter anaerophilus]RXJ62201.1 UDP-4-amino-4,6-dideoxy-N-acetyl-beta-L-altrosamine transaminase [Halarcobacter anaerophilus]
MDFIPYGKQNINKKDIKAVIKTLKSDFLTTGPKVKEFEYKLCEYTGAKYCVAVSNGTAALHLASLALLDKNDKVLTTPNSFLATSNSILYAGAKPIFVDIGEDGNIDLDLCEKELKKDPTIEAIYAVHFSGKSVDQKKLKKLKEKYDIKIVEDCAHSLGASFKGIKAGSCTYSNISTFSFHPVKHITTGEGGAITTNSKKLYEKLLLLRNHGMVKDSSMKPWEYEMRELGFNYRLTDISCALGLNQIKRLDKFLKKRRKIAKEYDKAFKETNTLVTALYPFDEESSYHLYVVKVKFDKLKISKEEFFMKMREKGIGLQVHYIPINKQPFYKKLGYRKENTPNTDKYYKEVFSIPMYPGLKNKEQKYVIKSLFEVLND